jgi:hypothetical protein
MGPFLRYTALRLAVLAGVGGALWLAGLRGLLWALVSVLVAAALSYVLLTGPREALLAQWSAARAARTAQPPRAQRLRRAGAAPSDEDVEDARVDAAERDRRPGT